MSGGTKGQISQDYISSELALPCTKSSVDVPPGDAGTTASGATGGNSLGGRGGRTRSPIENNVAGRPWRRGTSWPGPCALRAVLCAFWCCALCAVHQITYVKHILDPFYVFFTVMGVWSGGGGGARGLDVQFSVLGNSKMEISETDFFDILTVHNYQITYVEHVLDAQCAAPRRTDGAMHSARCTEHSTQGTIIANSQNIRKKFKIFHSSTVEGGKLLMQFAHQVHLKCLRTAISQVSGGPWPWLRGPTSHYVGPHGC